MQHHLYTNPLLAGISADQVTAMVAAFLQYLQAKSTGVQPAAQASAAPPPEGSVGGDPKQAAADMDDVDPLTSDDEENELIEANKKEEDTFEKAKIRRSVKVAKKAKSGKGAAATSVAAPVVKATIAKAAA